jgi:hypothetical protein
MNSLCRRIQEEKDYSTFAALLRELNDLVRRKERRFPQHDGNHAWSHDRPWKTVPAVVQKIIKSVYPDQMEKIEISIPSADALFREVRIENSLSDVDGQPVELKSGVRLVAWRF